MSAMLPKQMKTQVCLAKEFGAVTVIGNNAGITRDNFDHAYGR